MILVTHPMYLLYLIPLFLVLIILLKFDFVRLDHDLKENKRFMRKRKALKAFLFITRFIIFGLIILLFAQPFIELQTTEAGDPKITMLVDNSSSMDVFDLEFLDSFVKEIDKKIPVILRYISSDKLQSDLGEEALRYMEEDTNILLVSDMQSTSGISLNEVASFTTLLNSTISGINLKTTTEDVAVSIDGPSNAIKDQDTFFLVKVNRLNVEDYNILITVDEEPVYNARDDRDIIDFSHKFEPGTHQIVAKIIGEDDIPENNVFYKTVHVLPKPKVLYVTRTNSILPDLLREYYDVTLDTSIPANLSKYYSLIIEDMNTNQISNIEEISRFTRDGNGLFVIGGMNSFDRGGYKSSEFETILPVRIGRGDKKQGDSNIVILIDMSGSTQNYWTKDAQGNLVEIKDSKPLDVIKALAIDVIETLNRGNRVGVVAFAIQDPNSPDKIDFKAVKIADIEKLSTIKEMAVEKIGRIQKNGQSLFDVGFAGAYSLLKHESGSRNVILISDGGKNIFQDIKENALKTVKIMASQGIKTYTVGVGRNIESVDEDYLKQLAFDGNGLYFPAGQENRLKILFGTPEEKDQGDEMFLFVLNPTHFITKDLELDASVYGFNQVVPKSMARTIITTDSGEPALVEWRYGLGKVVALTVFSGAAGLGDILDGENSKLIVKSLNYLIGDPLRKEEYYVNIPDTRINELAKIEVISKDYPKSDLELVKIKENYYEGKTKVHITGFNELLNKEFAVNYPREFQKLGMHSNAEAILESTGGELFDIEDTNEIVNHIKSISKRTRIKRTFIFWPIIAIIIITYLFEVAVRKLVENRQKI